MRENSVKNVKTDNFTISAGYLDVGHEHKIWYEQWGNENAEVPILIFHGGPGGMYKAKHKRNFDPKKHQIIVFDQRGCGNSLPYGDLKNNTTSGLIADANKILDYLEVSSVHLYGGSWGSTLALLFAISYPDKVASVLIKGIFAGTQQEIDWLDKGLFVRHYPEVWERFKASVPADYAAKPASYHYQKLITESQRSELTSSAKALQDLEVPVLTFDWTGYEPDVLLDADPATKPEEYDYVPYRIFAHYFSNACFVKNDYILQNAHKINAPLYIIQGRYDMTCPPITAYKLHGAVPGSKLIMTLGGHDHGPENRAAEHSLIAALY